MAFLLLLGACQLVQSLVSDPAAIAAEGEARLRAGDLAGAAGIYADGLKKHPADVDLSVGSAYLSFLSGDYAAADATLAAAKAGAGARVGELELRRALVALAQGDLDRVKELSLASARPEGALLAAEVELADGDRDAAKAHLQSARSTAGPVGDVAGQYLALIDDPNVLVSGLSETQALWALGQRSVAVRSVADLVNAYAEGHEDGPEQLLLWAGRAAAIGEYAVAQRLLDSITVPPPGQAWRVQATRGIALCAEGRGPECVATLDGVASLAPGDGLTDAKATAALAIAEKDAGTARQLLEGLRGDAAARAWLALGDEARASSVAADPLFKLTLGGAG